MDRDGSFTLEREELNEGMMVYGVELDDTEGGDLDKIMKYFDRDGSGKVSVEEFMRGVRGTMHKRRIKLVKQAFALLDNTGDGVCTIEDFQSAYDTSEHPQVKAGNMSADEALLEFMEVFESGKADGIIAWCEFLDYYKDLSAGIDNDDYFELMIRNAWHMSGGEGWCGNTTCRRVLVTHSDGSQEVLEIENDLGLRADDVEGMKDRLRAQGVQDIQKISLAD
jgi:Ca2+-binding EF-hand superfamily protein